MSKKRNGDSWIQGSFVAITSEMITSVAYRELSGITLKTFILCMKKVRETNRAERFKVIFPFSYAEAKAHGISCSSFWRAINQLHKVGFLDFYMRGGIDFVNGTKTPSAYKLSLRWKKYGTPEFEQRHSGECEAINAV